MEEKLQERKPETFDPHSIVAAVVSWMQSDAPLYTAFSFDGGWEGWAQINIAMVLQHATSDAKITREGKIYQAKPNRRADLFIISNDTTKNPNLGVELKCRTKAEDRKGFQERFMDDLDKISLGIKGDACPCEMWAMAITNDEHDVYNWKVTAGTKYINTPAVYLKAGGWFLILWQRQFEKPNP